MKIFQVIFLPDTYQTIYQKDANLLIREICLRGKPRRSIWPSGLELEVTEPDQPRGILLQWSAGEFVLTKEAQEDQVLLHLLGADGEFLPVLVDGESLLLHNITQFADCVDEARSIRGLPLNGVPDIIRFPCFHANKVPLGIHFRLREYPGARYIATDSSLPPEKDFYQWYHKMGYKGLKFRLLWDSDKSDELIRFY